MTLQVLPQARITVLRSTKPEAFGPGATTRTDNLEMVQTMTEMPPIKSQTSPTLSQSRQEITTRWH
jgi:hypothetical protein